MIWEAKLVPSATAAPEAALDLFIFCHHLTCHFFLTEILRTMQSLKRWDYDDQNMFGSQRCSDVQRCPKHQNCSQSPSVLFGACAGSSRRCVITVLSSCAEPGADTRGTIHRTGARSRSGNVARPSTASRSQSGTCGGRSC
jgi:hypothetical protein